MTDERLVIGDVVDWRRVATLVRALGATVEPGSASWSALERLVLGLTDPLRRLDALAAQLRLAVRGDDHAADGARAALGELAALVRTAGLRTAISGERGHGHGAGCRCSCGCDGDDGRARPVLGRGERSARPTGIPAVAEQSSSVVDDDPGSILDEEQLAALLLAAVLVAGPDRRQEAADVVAGLVLASALVTSLGLVHAAEGEVGLVDRLESLAGQGLLAWVGTPLSREPVPMQTMSGQMPGGPGGIPGLPPGWQPGGLPGGGIPGIGGIPGAGLPGVPDLEDPFGDLIDALLGRVKGKRRWDPEKYDHSYPWWIEPQRYIDPRTAERVRCVLEVNRQLAARNEPAPARPTPAVWSEGITEVSLSGPCAGATITITGVGFGSTRPAGVTLVLPTLAGCRPATADSWSDTRITAMLPADVGSGPVGFADAAYVAAVDAWAARRNAADAVLATLTCATYVPTLTRPFHECPPPTSINAILAGVPVISAFTANGETVLPLEPGVPLVLRWSVQNAQTLTVERVSASGPGFAGSSGVADPPASQWALGTPSYSTLQVWTYRLTATGACGGPVSREVTVVAGKRPRLRIEQIEVTQSIQDPAGSMPLVESKPTAVRVTVRHGLDGWGADIVPGVRGRIRVRTPGLGTSPWFDAANQGGPPMAPNPAATITVKANPSRNLTDDTLNFVVPPGWARGDQVRLDIEVRVLMFGASSGFPGYSEQVTGRAGPMRFERRRTLQLRYVEVSLNGAPGPGAATCTRVLTESVALLPTPTAGIAALPGGGAALNFSSGNGSDERRDLLEDWDDEHNCSTFESLFEWLGYDCPEDDGAIWVLIPSVQATGFFPGEAYDIPSNVCMTPPTDGTYAAHELAHCLNQEHVRTSCGTGAAPTGGVAPSAWPNNGILSDIPFDTVRNVALTLAGAQVGDVMTYCGTPNNTWPSPQRWLQLWAEIGS